VGAEEGAKAPGGQPLRVTRKGRAEIAAPESGRSPQQKLRPPLRERVVVMWNKSGDASIAGLVRQSRSRVSASRVGSAAVRSWLSNLPVHHNGPFAIFAIFFIAIVSGVSNSSSLIKAVFRPLSG
jgi:hypothetical protein